MANFCYRCINCERYCDLVMPLGQSKEMVMCPHCPDVEMYRVITSSSFSIKGASNALGSWYKEQTGKEFMKDC